MLKKASTVVAAVAGLMMVGGPAFAVAGEPHEHGNGQIQEHSGTTATAIGSWQVVEDGDDGDVNDQFGLLNFADDSDVAGNINICEIEVNAVLGIPVLSNNDESLCLNADNDG
ncbi:hypothetical protein FHX81_3521 [Saccharothrix saharensis]|uniref:Secreted protein n=1 Tax=Saccharothrix saharensis TaxID=571190 RepID=A0A543JEC2_9PSEU|nr:hypothetical protein [Saccharothrix saharensis]TQM81160.1 hypothetical protein FHX81_3521 [Saccharothrix saharensis]